MKKIVALIIWCTLCSCSTKVQKAEFSVDFSVTDTVQLLGEGFISGRFNERDFTMSSSGDEFYYTVQHPRTGYSVIMQCIRKNGAWNQPEVVSFSGTYKDLEPFLSTDDQTIYFSSNRPIVEGELKKDFDLWYVKRNVDGWGEPIHLGPIINSDKDEFYPAVSRNGNIYFTSKRDDANKEDIFVSYFQDGTHQTPQAVSAAINTSFDEFNAFVSADEDYIIFSSFGRSDDLGRGDLYISFKSENGDWTPSMNLGENVNSSFLDFCPFVSADGKYLFFSSDRFDRNMFNQHERITWEKFVEISDAAQNGSSNIFKISFDEILKRRPQE